MKKNSTYLISIVFIFMTIPVWAAGVTIPHSFSSGTKAMASEVNDNFNAVQSSVDDNYTRIINNVSNITNNTANIAANTANKQNRVTGACGAGYTISAVNANGTVVCQADTNTTYNAGSGLQLNGTTFSVAPAPTRDLVISYFRFRPWWAGPDQCHIGSFGAGYYYYTTTTTYSNCDAYAPINLPDGATLTGLSCNVYDNTSNASLKAVIFTRTKSGGSDYSTGFATANSVDSTSMQTLSYTGSYVIHNNADDYILYLDSSNSDTVGSYLKIFSCTLTYYGP